MMLKLFVILVFAAVVFGDNSSMNSLMTAAKLKSTTTMLTATTTQTTTAVPTSTLKSTPTATSTTAATTATPTTSTSASKTATSSTTAATTATPTTSTSASKTTAPHLTSSPKPTKTTTPPPTTTPHPTTPSPPSGNFSLRDNKTGNYCILARFDASFTIKLHLIVIKDNTTSIKWNKTLRQHIDSDNDTMRDDVEVTGDCGVKRTNASLVLSWPKKNQFYRLTMDFQTSPSDNMTWMVHKITFKVTLKNNSDLSPPPGLRLNASSVLGTYNPPSGQLRGQVGGYYLCNDKTPFPLTTNVTNIALTSQFENVHLEPFVDKKSALDFGKDKTECKGDSPPKKPTKGNDEIVPIAVGCALAGLVLIVLIAYVIGRRKSHSGYEKV